MPISQELESKHQDLLWRIEESWRADREQTKRLVKDAIESIRWERNNELKERRIKAYESLRTTIIKEYIEYRQMKITDIQALTESIASMRITPKQEEILKVDTDAAVNSSLFERGKVFPFQRRASKTNTLPLRQKENEIALETQQTTKTKDELLTQMAQDEALRARLLKSNTVLDNQELWKNIVTIASRINNWKTLDENLVMLVKTVEKKDTKLAISILNGFSEKMKSSVQLWKSVIDLIENTNLFKWAIPWEIWQIVSQVQWFNKWALWWKLFSKVAFWEQMNKDEFAKNILPHLDKGETNTFLVDIDYPTFLSIIKSPELLKVLTPEEIKKAEEVREWLYKSFNKVIDDWLAMTWDGRRLDIKEEDITLVNTQLWAQGGIENYRDKFKMLVAKDNAFLWRIEVLKNDPEMVLNVLKRNKSLYVIQHIGTDVINQKEIIDTIISSQEDKQFIKTLSTQVSWEGKTYLKERIKELWIDVSDMYAYTYNIDSDSQARKAQIQERLWINEGYQEFQIKESWTDKWEMMFNKNENGTYDVFVRWEKIPWLTAEEYEWLWNEDVRENLLHFYTVLKDCWLEQIWGQRETIFKAITNQKGIAFNTKDGDYLGKNEVKIFLQSIIKSIAPQFKDQWELAKALNTENEQEIISFIKNYNGENNLAGPAKDKLGRTKITELFFDTYFPQDSDRRFQQASFENSLTK